MALEKSLSLTDLVFFGIASIIGSGGFNLIGEAVMKAGNWWPAALAIASAVLMGGARTYEDAWEAFKTNTAESDFVKKVFGDQASDLTATAVLLWNILSISTILVICSHMLFPEGTWFGQITFALTLLGAMGFLSLRGIDINKEVINFFTAGLILILTAASVLGLGGLATKGLPSVPAISGQSFVTSLLYFFFILAGFDALIKFTEEAKDPKDIPRSFYISNALSTSLVLGLCIAFVTSVDMRKLRNFDNGIGEIFQAYLGGNTKTAVTYFSVIYMIITTFVAFLATTRYMYGLGDVYKGLEFMKTVNEAKAPTTAIFSTLATSAATILVNHAEWLVRAADFSLASLLFLVASAAAKEKGALVEGGTAVSFAGLMALSFLK